MERSRFRTRPSALMGVVLLSLGALAACGTGPVGRSAAATVDGYEIGTDRVIALLDAQTRYLESQLDNPGVDPQAVASALAQVTGVGAGTYDMTEASAALQAWINYRITVAHVEANGESITDADREAARASLASQLGGEEALASVDEELLGFSIDSEAANTAMERVLAKVDPGDREQRLQELFEEVAPQRPLCLDIIVSDTEADSQAALERVRGGEDFSTVATEVSADPATAEGGGFAGCASVERAAEYFGGDYSTVAQGEVVGPVTLDELFILVHVRSTTGPTFEQLRTELEQQLASEDSNLAQQYLQDLRLAADVSVDPRFGTWNPETGALTPPAV